MNEYTQIALRAAVIATIGSVIVYLVADALGASMLANQPGSDEPEEVPLLLVIVQSFAFPLIGAVFAWFISKRRSTGPRIFTWLAVAIFVLLSISALVNGDGAGTIVALLLMHIVVLVPTLRWIVPALPAPAIETA